MPKNNNYNTGFYCFNKDNAARVYPLLKQAITESNLPQQAFAFNDQNHTIDCTLSLVEWEHMIQYCMSRSDDLKITNLFRNYASPKVRPDCEIAPSSTFFISSSGKYSSQRTYTRNIHDRMKSLTVKEKDYPPIPESSQKGIVNMQDFFECCLSSDSGIIFGDTNHLDLEPKLFLSHNMQTFKKLGIQYLVLEHFMDSQQPAIEQYFKTGQFPTTLDVYIKQLDNRGYIGFRNIFESAREHGIKIIAAETSESYVIKTGSLYGSQNLARINAGTLAMYDTIQNLPKDAKWIAMIGSAHLGLANEDAPSNKGLDDLLGMPAICLQKANKDQKPTISFDEMTSWENSWQLLDVVLSFNADNLQENYLVHNLPEEQASCAYSNKI